MYFKYFKLITFFLLTCCNNLSVSKLPYFITPDFTPFWINNYSKIDSLHKIKDFSFVNQNNEIIDKEYIKEKIVVSNFFSREFTNSNIFTFSHTDNNFFSS